MNRSDFNATDAFDVVVCREPSIAGRLGPRAQACTSGRDKAGATVRAEIAAAAREARQP